MIFRQLFDHASSTYTYLLAARQGGEALIIDPVRAQVPHYLQLIDELGLELVFAVDTHLHADHVTGLGRLSASTACTTVMGSETKADCVARRLQDGEIMSVDGLAMKAIYTPGHTDDSYSFVLDQTAEHEGTVFTGDTLLIRGTGRTDFQNGDPRAQYDSLFGRILTLPDTTIVRPAHDYKGWTASTIGEERSHNPRLQVTSVEAYVEIMNNLQLPNPQQMDVAIPANLQLGQE
jgi:sulfur dioxygenase